MPTIEDIAARTLKAGKHAGIFVMDTAYTGRFKKMGYTFMALGNEQKYVSMGASALIGAAREALG